MRLRLLDFRLGLLSVGLASAGLFFLLIRHYALLEPERWFMPGELGHERGRRAIHTDRPMALDDRFGVEPAVGRLSPASGRAYSPKQLGGWYHAAMDPVRAEPRQAGRGGFLTRALGVDAEWGRHNHLTEALAFSHNLGNVFPPDLARDHPEFFPLADGRRLQPPTSGALFWNPDLGRPDVALHAAEAARKYFVAHPDALSFALGVNDALIWGESPELLSLTSSTERTAEDRGQRTEDRGQRTEDRGQRTVDRGQRTVDRGQRTENRGQTTVVGPVGPKWFRERPDYSNLVFTFMNRAAEELSRTHPQKYLGALAYYWAENAPGFPLHPQVIPFLTADRAQGYDASFRREEFDLQERWGKLAGRQTAEDGGQATTDNRRQTGDNGDMKVRNEVSPGLPSAVSRLSSAPARRLGMYDYLFGSGFLIPRIHTKLLAENLRHARRAGFTDYYAEMSPNWGLDGPMPWLTAQLLQDPEQSETALLDEYYRRYFKEAAPPMRRFFERCEDLWMKQPGPPYWLKHYRNESQAVVFPSEACRELRTRLDEATRLAVSEKVRRRVRLVSDAFGVTERFVLFQEARDRVARLSLAAAPDLRRLTPALESYLASRREFIRYTTRLRREQPLALAAFGWDDYLKNDPVALGSRPATLGRELLRDPGMGWEVKPARTIAGLEYGVALPADWFSQVEPSQFHRAELLGRADARILRISGSKDTTVSQWDPVGGTGLHCARIAVRGRVSPGTAVSLVFAWLDEKGRHVGFKAVRLPDGEWPEWVALQQAGTPPAGAVWVGMGLRVQNQVRSDWIEARGFSLEHFLATNRTN